jgi:hypothetical protein
MLFARGDAQEPMAMAEVFIGEATLFRTEKQGNTAAGRMLAEEAGGLVQAAHGVLQLPKANRSGSNNESAILDGFSNGLEFFGFGEQRRGADGGTGLAKCQFVGVHDAKMEKAEIAHGARGGADVERVARGDKNDPQAVGFGISWQGS